MYCVINRLDIIDMEMEIVMDIIVDSFFCFFVILGVVFIIRCLRGIVVEMVVVKLDKKFWENLRDVRNSFFIGDIFGVG